MNLLLGFLSVMLVVAVGISILMSTSRSKNVKKTVTELFGVSKKRVVSVLNEYKRKLIHLFSLLIPIIYYYGLKNHFLTRVEACWILGGLVVLFVSLEIFRLHTPLGRAMYEWFPQGLKRPEESKQMLGSTYFMTGSFFTIFLFNAIIANCAILFLILGDIAAAMFGRAFGTTKIYGKKSLQGSLACFITCLVIGLIGLWGVPTCEFIALTGAITATLVELFNPSFLNDNLTIPLASAFAMTMAQWRLGVEIPILKTGI